MRLCAPPSRQRGIAMLIAVLLVALGTIIAAAIAYENAMSARRSVATFDFDEGILVAQGAEALAAYGLQQTLQMQSGQNAQSRTINLSQPWAQPVGPLEIVPGVMLDASLEDVTGRFNLNSLVDLQTGMKDPIAAAAFENLLQSLDIDPKWAGFVIDWIDPDTQPSIPSGAEDSVYMGQNPPYLTANEYITSTSELLAIPGFGRDNYQKLAPFITALPPDAKVNVCTAPGLVLDAYLEPGHVEFANPETLAKNRAAAGGCFPTLANYGATFTNPADYTKVQGKLADNSAYFRLTSHVTIGTTEFNLYSLLFLDQNGTSRPILRSYSPD
jgi:general secretion pathway protein K